MKFLRLSDSSHQLLRLRIGISTDQNGLLFPIAWSDSSIDDVCQHIDNGYGYAATEAEPRAGEDSDPVNTTGLKYT